MAGTTPTVPTGLAAANIHSDGSCDVSCNPSTNPSALKAGSFTGFLYGYYPQGGNYAAILTHEQQIGRKVGMFKRYLDSSHGSAATILGPDERAMASGGKLSTGQVVTGNRVPWINWELALFAPAAFNNPLSLPTFGGSTKTYGGSGTNDVITYDQIVAGSFDALIDLFSTAIKNFGDPVFFSVDHEADMAVTATSPGGFKGTNHRRAAAFNPGAGNDPTWSKYAAAMQHIYTRMVTTNGVTNAVFVHVVSGSRGCGLSLYTSLYPGTAYNDWVAFDPYDHGAQTGSAQSAASLASSHAFNSTLDADTWAAGVSSKPRMLGEFGCQYRNNGTRATTFFPGMVAMAGVDSPHVLKGGLYFASGTWGDLHTLSSTGAITATWDQASINALKSATTGVNNSLFLPDVGAGGSGIGGYNFYDGATKIATLTGNPAAPTQHLTGLTTGNNDITATCFDTTTPTPNESAKSAALVVDIPGTPPAPPPTPGSFAVNPAGNPPQATASWTASTGAGGYRLYRRESTDSGSTWSAWSVLTQLDSLTFSYTTQDVVAGPPDEYEFYVVALDSTLQVESTPSATVSYTGSTTLPQPSALTSVTATGSTVNNATTDTVSWSLPTDPLVAGVQLFIGLDPNDPQNVGIQPDQAFDLSTTTWTDPNALLPLQTQTYYMVTVSAAGAISATVQASVTAPAAVGPTAVINLSAAQLPLNADGVSGATYTMDASQSTSASGLPLTYMFSVNDGGGDLGPASNPIAARTVFKEGIYTVTLTVSDGTYTSTATATILITNSNGTVVSPYLGMPDFLWNQRFWSLDPNDPDAMAFWADMVQRFALIDAGMQALNSAIGSGGLQGPATPQSGDYIYNDGLTGTTATQTLGSGYNHICHFVRLLVPNATAFDAVGTDTTQSGTADGTQQATFALYADDGTGKYPTGAPLLTSAAVSLTGASGWKEDATISWTSPGTAGGWGYVWVACDLSTMSGATTWAQLTTDNSGLVRPSAPGGTYNRGWSQSALPAPPNPIATGSLNSSGAPFVVGLKVA